MKKYIGTKLIEAEPMTRGDYNKYKGWAIPADENPNDDGYKVKYNNNYISWSPAKEFEEAYSEIGINPLYDTAILMKSADFKDRFKAEYYQLKSRMTGLFRMLENYKSGTLKFTPKCSLDLLNSQFKAMDMYASYLEERAKIECIEL